MGRSNDENQWHYPGLLQLGELDLGTEYELTLRLSVPFPSGLTSQVPGLTVEQPALWPGANELVLRLKPLEKETRLSGSLWLSATAQAERRIIVEGHIVRVPDGKPRAPKKKLVWEPVDWEILKAEGREGEAEASGYGPLPSPPRESISPDHVPPPPPAQVKVGLPRSLPKETVVDHWKDEPGFYLVRSDHFNGQDIVVALRAGCTHQGCTSPIWVEGGQRFKCPRHQSCYNINGINLEGPATRPLERLRVALDADGQVVVDPGQRFRHELGEWSNPESYVVVPPPLLKQRPAKPRYKLVIAMSVLSALGAAAFATRSLIGDRLWSQPEPLRPTPEPPRPTPEPPRPTPEPLRPTPEPLRPTPEPPRSTPEPPPPTEVIKNSIGLRLVLIPAGDFEMGVSQTEFPPHHVTITRPFYLGESEVRQGEWLAVMKRNPSWWSPEGGGMATLNEASIHDTKLHPVESVTWFDTILFCNRLSELENLPPYYSINDMNEVSVPDPLGAGYRLPTEAEWEYACRGGNTHKKNTIWSFGNDEAELDKFAWFGGEWTHPACGKIPNAFKLYDMHGNVAEWCWDWDAPYHDGDQLEDPHGPSTGRWRIIRGGAYHSLANDATCAHRTSLLPDAKNTHIGFRVARSLPRP